MTNTTANEFKNDDLNVHVTRGPNCLITLEIEVTPQATEAAYSKAIKNVSKEVSLPGFRKGRAPEAMLVRQYPSQIDREFRDIALNTAFREALNLVKMFPYRERESVQKIDVQKCSREEGAQFKIVYESFPTVPSVDPTLIHVEKVAPASFGEKEVAEEIEQVAYRHATWEDVHDRAAQEGDFVDVDITAIDEGNERSICKDTRFLVAKGKMGAWMQKLIIGLKVGESAEGISEREEEDAKTFESTQCRILVKGIKTAKLPEIDDELAKKVGATSLADLKEKITKTLAKRTEEEAKAQSRKKVHEEILKQYPFDLPASLLKAEKESRLQNKMHWLQHQKFPNEEKTRLGHEFEQEAHKEADHSLRTQYLLFKVIQDNKIEVSQEELLQELVKQMMLPEEERMISNQEDLEATRSELRRVILFRKALDFIDQKANHS